MTRKKLWWILSTSIALILPLGVACGDKPLWQMGRYVETALPLVRPLTPAPLVNRTLPQQDSIEGVPSYEEPLVGQTSVEAHRRFVGYVEQPAAG